MDDKDLATVEGVLSYLEPTAFASVKAESLTGGFGNYIHRIYLRQPYKDKATLVVKHGKSFIPGARSIAFSLDRQKYDATAMQRVRKVLPATSLVTTPDVHLLDEVANVIVMDDCGEDGVALKNLLLQNALSASTARVIGSMLGVFLAQLHSWGKGEDVLDFFDGNTQARTLSAWATYGRLVETLSDSEGRLKALQDPPLDVSESQLNAVGNIADATAHIIRTARETLLHGDFWPGNVMVKLRGEGEEAVVERVFVLDWELAKPGLPGFDIGQFCAELHQARRFYPSTEKAASALLETFLGAYREHCGDEDMADVARIAQTHLGAHLAVWTPRNSTWGNKEIVREVVMEGVQHLLDAEREGNNLCRTVFGPLVR